MVLMSHIREASKVTVNSSYFHPAHQHYTDEAHKAETVPSVVIYIYIYIYIYIVQNEIKNKNLMCCYLSFTLPIVRQPIYIYYILYILLHLHVVLGVFGLKIKTSAQLTSKQILMEMQFNNRSFIISRHSFYRVCLGITVGIVSSMVRQSTAKRPSN